MATLHVLTSYGVAQDIELRTNDAGLVDRFEVVAQKPRRRSSSGTTSTPS